VQPRRGTCPRHPGRERIVEEGFHRRHDFRMRGIRGLASLELEETREVMPALVSRRVERDVLQESVRERPQLRRAARRRAGRWMLVEAELVEKLVAARADGGVGKLRDGRDDGGGAPQRAHRGPGDRDASLLDRGGERGIWRRQRQRGARGECLDDLVAPLAGRKCGGGESLLAVESVRQHAQQSVEYRQGRVEAGAPRFRSRATVAARPRRPAGKDQEVAGPGTGYVEEPAHLRGIALLVNLVDPSARRAPSFRASVGGANLEAETELGIHEDRAVPRFADRRALGDDDHREFEPLRSVDGEDPDRVRVVLLDDRGVRLALIEVLHPAGERDEAPRRSTRDLVLAGERDELLDVGDGLLAGEAGGDRRDVVGLGKRGLEQRRWPEPIHLAGEALDEGDDPAQRCRVVRGEQRRGLWVVRGAEGERGTPARACEQDQRVVRQRPER
jgi:hypothetical protein